MTVARSEPGFEEHSEAYVLFSRGRWFLDRGHPGQAVLLLERALALEPGRNSIREALGRAFFSLGQTQRAAEQFACIVAEVPDNDYAQYALGRCLLKLGQTGEGRGRLRLAAALSPGTTTYRDALLDVRGS